MEIAVWLGMRKALLGEKSTSAEHCESSDPRLMNFPVFSKFTSDRGRTPVKPLSVATRTVVQGMQRARLESGGKRAFSLVEVVLSIGIVAFAFVPLMGLLPLGLDFSRQAVDTTITAQIAQQLKNEALQTDFTLLSTLDKDEAAAPGYFDDQGNKSTDPQGAIYKTTYAVSGSTDLPEGIATGRLKTVTICILNTKANRTSQETDLMKNPDARKTIVLISDNGR
jgi:uncharacterized protein (TIGR02598 family)